jgi:hypothetical protein
LLVVLEFLGKVTMVELVILHYQVDNAPQAVVVVHLQLAEQTVRLTVEKVELDQMRIQLGQQQLAQE